MSQLNLRFTDHARDVMRRRGLTIDEVIEIVARPQIREVSNDYAKDRRPGEDNYRYVVGNLAVVVAESRSRKHHIYRTVLTILLRQNAQWTDEDVRRR